VALLLASTLAGIAVGLLGDLAAGGTAPSLDDVWSAVLLAPFTVTCGGGVTAVGQAERSVGVALFIGGLLFWPVYFLLARRWLERGTRWLWLLIFLWCTQGFFQVVHRLWAIMSV
jgi:uncharacterized membrane protein YhaH (DUF805 family)